MTIKVGCKSPRALGNALHKNPFAPLVPCHRVVRANGEVGGYAFGSHEKIVVIPNPLALDWSILSEVNRIVLSFLYFKATDSIMQSGLCLSNPLGFPQLLFVAALRIHTKDYPLRVKIRNFNFFKLL